MFCHAISANNIIVTLSAMLWTCEVPLI